MEPKEKKAKHGNGALALDVEEWVNEEEGRVSRRIFVDPDIYALEVERLFNRCWLFLGHETEVSQPGDYVARHMGKESAWECEQERNLLLGCGTVEKYGWATSA